MFRGLIPLVVVLTFVCGNVQGAPMVQVLTSSADSIADGGPVVVSSPNEAKWYHPVDSVDFSPRYRTLIYGPDSTCRPMSRSTRIRVHEDDLWRCDNLLSER